MAILGVDYGTRRIGLALCDDSLSAHRLPTVEGGDGAVERIVEVCRQHEISVVVVGLPRNLDGEDTQQTKLVRKFVGQLEAEIDLAVVLQDEADTTNQAKKRLEAEKLKEPEIKKVLDSEAAVIILEDYLRGQ